MSTAVTSPANPQAFAGVLTRIALAASNQSPAENHPNLSAIPFDDPEDTTDISLLSYESALRRPAPAAEDSLSPSTLPAVSLSGQQPQLIPQPFRRGRAGQLVSISHADQEDNRKRCTISIRLSPEEIDLLRLRAGESGISVSAYIRSCVLEADSLRAQVKQALATLNSPPPAAAQPTDSLLSASLSAASALPLATPVPRRPASTSSWLRRVLALLLGRPVTFPISAD